MTAYDYARQARLLAYTLQHADDVPLVDGVDVSLQPFLDGLASLLIEARAEDNDGAAALTLHHLAEHLKGDAAVARRHAKAASAYAKLLDTGADAVRDAMGRILAEAPDRCVVTPAGTLRLRRTGKPTITAAPDDVAGWPLAWLRPQPPKPDRVTATKALAEMHAEGLTLPEGFELDADPAHPFFGV